MKTEDYLTRVKIRDVLVPIFCDSIQYRVFTNEFIGIFKNFDNYRL